MQRAFPSEILHFIKKKHKIATPEKSTSSDENNIIRITTKTVLESLKDSLQMYVVTFILFFVFY